MGNSKRAINGLSRRQFLLMTATAATSLAMGCATNPVTGKSQFMLMDEDQEIAIDQRQSPHQISADYGDVQDRKLLYYLQTTGQQLVAHTHRVHMPYRFHCVNAIYVNAYAFPGGTIACTRGILLDLESEAELAALLGHELGHVNARHSAASMSKAQAANMAVGGLAILTSATMGSGLGSLAGQLGMLGSGALLATYSRDNERQADDLGMQYMTQAGYGPQGMVALMDMLNGMDQHQPGVTDLLFATHPMSSERHQTSVDRANTDFRQYKDQPLYRERYMDHTAGLRKIKPAVATMQAGQQALAEKQFSQAQELFKQALKQVPGDYTGLLLMAKCQLIQNRDAEAGRYADQAKQAYPKEAQAYHVSGIANLRTQQFEAAYQDFSQYETLLPGNPNTIFFQGLALEGMQKIDPAAHAFHAFLKQVQQGEQAQYAYQRLREWGYLK
jgi:predicted Zn-dependent protease